MSERPLNDERTNDGVNEHTIIHLPIGRRYLNTSTRIVYEKRHPTLILLGSRLLSGFSGIRFFLSFFLL